MGDQARNLLDILALSSSEPQNPPNKKPAATPVLCLVDLIRAYSNRSDLLDDLERAVRQLARVSKEPREERQSVGSTGRVGRVWAMSERLGKDAINEIIRGYEAGVIQVELAERAGISLSSVKRILRRYRASL